MRAIWGFCGALGCLVGTSAYAADDVALPSAEQPTHIYGGEETSNCGWPSVAYLSHGNGACTATLIHPEIVLTAAHCVPGDPAANIRFGESSGGAFALAETEYCRANPNFFGTGGGEDYGFCKLKTPIDTLPIIPVAFGCEQSIVQPGAQVTHVGYGVDENGSGGRKKFVSVQLDAVTGSGELISGTASTGVCSGDSGGPTMIKLPASVGGDDTWRVVGIHSWAAMAEQGVCNGQAGSTLAWRAINFIEQESGIDVTPCHTASGEWDPTWACQEFPMTPSVGGEGSYTSGTCPAGQVGGFSEICGPPLTDFPDSTPPSVTMVTPNADVMIEVSGGALGEVNVEVDATDGDGWGLEKVELVIAPENGDQVVDARVREPYTWSADFPVGGYHLRAIGYDNAGNITETEWVAVGVGTPPPDGPAPGEDEGGSDGGTDDGGTDGGTAGDDGNADGGEGGGGKGCTLGGTAPTPAAALFLLALAAIRRRALVA